MRKAWLRKWENKRNTARRPLWRWPTPSGGWELEPRQLLTGDPLMNIDHFVVIYQENWSFDGLYGKFPGANGTIASAVDSSGNLLTPQIDKVTGLPLTSVPQPINNGVPDARFPATLPPKPYDLSTYVSTDQTTGDIVHRYWQEQSQIDGGKMDKFVTWSDNGGLVLSNFDATSLPEGLLAQQYTMDDNFFHAAYGGSFLNHQFLVAAAPPVFPDAATATPSSLPTLAPDGQLALDSKGNIIHDGKITPINSTFDQNYAVNTIFSTNLVPTFKHTTDSDLLPSQNDSNPSDPTRPYIPTIGDSLDTANISWKYYAGGWNAALDSSPTNPNRGSLGLPVDPLFQWHHQPFAYYDNFAPWLPNGQRNPVSAAHLQDENNFFSDLSTGQLPAVSFIKPLGPDNEHPGYTSVLQGQQHVADIVHAVQNSPDWAHTAIVITYDENGGRWDPVAPPNRDIWGDGTRVPGIVISPYSKMGEVDHTSHDTLSILKSVETRFGLKPLNARDANASSLSSSLQSTPDLDIGRAYLQPDAQHVGMSALIVGGTQGDDQIDITMDSQRNVVQVSIQGGSTHVRTFFDANALSRIEVYGQGGADHINISPHVTVEAFVFAGSGNNTVQTGGGPSVVVGGAGNDTIRAGTGPAILIGGGGNNTLDSGPGSAIEIGGFTDFDANRKALDSLLAEWSLSSPGSTYATKVAHLSGMAGGLNGTNFLTPTTVHDNGAVDNVIGGPGPDWFFVHLTGLNQDKYRKPTKPGEVPPTAI
jgi:phospholipase C